MRACPRRCTRRGYMTAPRWLSRWVLASHSSIFALYAHCSIKLAWMFCLKSISVRGLGNGPVHKACESRGVSWSCARRRIDAQPEPASVCIFKAQGERQKLLKSVSATALARTTALSTRFFHGLHRWLGSRTYCLLLSIEQSLECCSIDGATVLSSRRSRVFTL